MACGRSEKGGAPLDGRRRFSIRPKNLENGGLIGDLRARLKKRADELPAARRSCRATGPAHKRRVFSPAQDAYVPDGRI
jgi:hypothetical protein